MSVLYKIAETRTEYTEALRLRIEVFVIEQGCPPESEPDEEDAKALHFIAAEANSVLATARARETNPQEYKIERVATKLQHRRLGIGTNLIHHILQELKALKAKRIWLQSQTHAIPFYQTQGFKVCSTQFQLDNMPHVDMELHFSPHRN